MNLKKLLWTGFFVALGLVSCRTKMDVQREQEMDNLRQEVRAAKGTKVDFDVVSDQMRSEITRMTNYVEEQTLLQRRQTDELKAEIAGMNSRLEALEKRPVTVPIPADIDTPAPEKKAERRVISISAGQQLIDSERYEDAADVFREVIHNGASPNEVRKAKYLLGESLFFAKNYASAALEYSEYKRNYPKDSRLAEATFRQGQCFKSLGKKKEARLFFQELLEKYPKSSLSARSREELRSLK